MSTTLESQQEAALRMLYAAIGAPVVVGQKAKDFGRSVFNDSSFDDFESAGREFTGHLQESKVIEQLQDSMDMEQFSDKVDGLRDQLESLLSNWREQFDATVKSPDSVKIEVEDEVEKARSSAKKTASTAKKTTTSTAKKATTTAKKKTTTTKK